MTANCPNCGKGISATTKFCRYCGYDLQSPLPASPAPSPSWLEPESELEPEPDDFEPEVQPRRRKWLLFLGLAFLFILFSILMVFSFRKALQSRVTGQIPTVESRSVNTVQPVVSEASPAATALVANLPPESQGSVVSGYDVFTSDGQSHPSSTFSYITWDCVGCAGGFDVKVEILGLDVEGNALILKLRLNVSNAWGEAPLFQILAEKAPAPDIKLVINDELVLEAVSTTLPMTITEQGLIIGDIVFNGQIPVTGSGEYKIALQIQDRGFQPLEGWLKSK